MTQQPTSLTSVRALLQRIGLDQKETDVYLALLSLKSARVSAISKASKQSRSHTYLLLRALEEKGLVSEVERGKVKHFIAESPQRLVQFLDNREKEIQDVKPLIAGAMPLLTNMTSGLAEQPRVTMMQGIEGMKQLYKDLLLTDYCAFFNPVVMYETFDKNIMDIVFPKTAEFFGRDLVVNSDVAKSYKEDMKIYPDHQIRFFPEGVHFATDTVIFQDTVALFAYDLDKTIVRIQNQNIADGFRAWFEVLWDMARES